MSGPSITSSRPQSIKICDTLGGGRQAMSASEITGPFAS
jgi:hypothetical protein